MTALVCVILRLHRLLPAVLARARSTLSSVSHVPLLKFNTMRNAFGNFSREEDFVKFVRRVNQLGSVWCCIDAHPGHIHYDFWWDVPHTDKFGRVWSKWEPKPGP